MALLAAYALQHASHIYSLPVALGIVLLSWWFFGHKRGPQPVDYGGPVIPGTRRWARTLYHNKLMSLDELQKFYESHPENEDFGE